MKKIGIFIAFILFSLMANAADNENFDVYLMIGQSNMAGRGELEQRDTTEYAEEVYLLDGDGNPVEHGLILSAPVNFYSLAPSTGLRYISPKLPKGNYTLKATVADMKSNWSDKKKNEYGSKVHEIVIINIAAIR